MSEESSTISETDSSLESDGQSTSTRESNTSSENPSSTIEGESVESEALIKRKYFLPSELISRPGRHIRAEDDTWIVYPVPSLVDMILESARNITGPELTILLQNANEEQRTRLQSMLPLELPLNITLSELKNGEYWKKRCLKLWSASDVWWYNGNWKSMFVERQVQESIESFVPGEADIAHLQQFLKDFKDHVFRLRIRSLHRLAVKPFELNLEGIDWQDFFDEFDPQPPHKCYVDLTALLPTFSKLEDLSIILSPTLLAGSENSEFPNADLFGILKCVKNLKLLQKFRLSNGGISNSQVVAAIRVFLKHPAIAELDFSFNFADDGCCDYFGKLLLSSSNSLQTLSLKYNRISDEGAMTLAAALTENTSLKKLNLSLNCIGDEGAAFLAKCLARNMTLESLDLSENKLGSKAGLAIAELLLLQTSALRLLNVSRNALGMRVGSSLKEALEKNTSLLELDIECCKFHEEDESAIHDALVRNRLALERFSYWDKLVNFV